MLTMKKIVFIGLFWLGFIGLNDLFAQAKGLEDSISHYTNIVQIRTQSIYESLGTSQEAMTQTLAQVYAEQAASEVINPNAADLATQYLEKLAQVNEKMLKDTLLLNAQVTLDKLNSLFAYYQQKEGRVSLITKEKFEAPELNKSYEELLLFLEQIEADVQEIAGYQPEKKEKYKRPDEIKKNAAYFLGESTDLYQGKGSGKGAEIFDKINEYIEFTANYCMIQGVNNVQKFQLYRPKSVITQTGEISWVQQQFNGTVMESLEALNALKQKVYKAKVLALELIQEANP